MIGTMSGPIEIASHKRASEYPLSHSRRRCGRGIVYRSRFGITRAGLICCGIVAAYLGLTATAAWAQHPEEEQVRRELERVFARPEFNPEPSVYLRQVLEWLFELFRRLNGLSSADPTLFWVIVISCVILLVLLVAHITWTVYQAIHMSPRLETKGQLDARRRRLSARFRAEADERAAAGDYTGAVRLLFLSLVHAFDETGRLLFRPSLTNREYLRYFADRPSVQEFLGFFVDLLDSNWYGQRLTESADYAHCVVLYDNLRRDG
jgi:hypothetical protein